VSSNGNGRAWTDGFTLIEVMVAMVILAVGLLGLQGLGISAARSVAAADWNTSATVIATEYVEGALREIRIHENNQFARPNARCEVVGTNQVSVEIDMIDPRLPRVSVTVRPASGVPANRTVTLTSHAFYDVPLTGPVAGAPCS
jgi:prepilin-type N-terminal cleavage/methylation domain-containing protein